MKMYEYFFQGIVHVNYYRMHGYMHGIICNYEFLLHHKQVTLQSKSQTFGAKHLNYNL